MIPFFVANLLFIATLAYFAYRGYKQGFFNALLSLAALIFGYAAALLLFRPLGQFLLDAGILKGILLAYAFGGMGAFILVQMLFAIPGVMLYLKVREWRLEGRVSQAYWYSGASVGVVRGFIYAVLIVWLLMFYRASHVTADSEIPPPSVSERITGSVMSTVSEQALSQMSEEKPTVSPATSDPAAPVSEFASLSFAPAMTQFVAQPDKGVKRLKVIVEHPELKHLMADAEFQKIIVKGTAHEIQNDPAFAYFINNLLKDQNFRQAVTDLGWKPQLEDEQLFKRQFAEVFVQVQGRLERLAHDPEAVAILQKPEIQAAIEKQDIWSLLNNEDFNRLLKIIAPKR